MRSYLSELGIDSDAIPSKSAFSQARYKILYSAFKEIHHKLVDLIYSTTSYKTWMGYRLLAVDGSTVQLPKNEANEKEFDSWNPKNGPSIVLGRISMLNDVLNETFIDARLLKKSIGERLACQNHLEHITSKDITIYDRGYACGWLMQYHLQNNKPFIMRLPIKKWSYASEMIRNGEYDLTINIEPQNTKEYLDNCAQLDLDEDSPIEIRLIRIKLPNGEDEVLATSITNPKVSIDDFDFIYQKRWSIEEDYKKLKARCKFEQFSGKKPEAIRQDFYAKIILININSQIIETAQEIVDQKMQDTTEKYKINKFESLCIVMRHFGRLIEWAYNKDMILMILRAISRFYERIRKNRAFPRIAKNPKCKYNPCYAFPV